MQCVRNINHTLLLKMSVVSEQMAILWFYFIMHLSMLSPRVGGRWADPACASAAEKMYVKRKEVMFIGDFNMNMLESPDNPNGPNKDLTKFSQQFCLTKVIHEATRTTNYSRTLLDIVLTP